MKRICFVFVAALLLILPAFAGEIKSHERFVVDVSGGGAFFSSLIAYGGDMREQDFEEGKKDAPDEVDYETNYAVGSIGARYFLYSRVEFGLVSSYEYYGSRENICSSKGKSDEVTCRAGDHIDHHLVHIAAEGKYNWFTFANRFRPYSRVGLGVILEIERGAESDVGFVMPSAHLTPMGIEILLSRVSLFVDYGWGYRGFLSGGVAFRI